MIKKFVAWLKALFAPAKIEEAKVDEYIAKQSSPVKDPLRSKNVKVVIDGRELTGFSGTPEMVIENKVVEPPKKSLDEQLKGVELPTYAQGKKLPPRAKRQFIKQAKTSGTPASARRLDDTPHSTGGQVTSHGIDPVNAALYGYAAGAILSDDTPSSPAPTPVEECRSSAAISTYSSSYSSSDDNHSSSSYSSSSSSYDSGSYDSGSSSSSCD